MLRLACPLLLIAVGISSAQTVEFKRECLADLVSQVPGILASQNPQTGRFGKGIWIVTDQNPMFPLAVAWHWRDAANPFFHSATVLAAIMSAGDALIADQDAAGQWVFRKKDGSTWGNIYMPWTYSRWIRAFALIREAMPEDRRARWETALRLGFGGIAKQVAGSRVQNIPAHHAMALQFAAKTLNQPEWARVGATYMRKVVAEQHSDGYWTEHSGPVVAYGFVYVDALGTYYAVTHDPQVLPALQKVARFHANFTYPDGTSIETVDERNPYHPTVVLPNVGFTFSPDGRSYFARQLALLRAAKKKIDPDAAASLLMWGEEGPGSEKPGVRGDFDYALLSGDAAIRRRGPWFIVVSALTAPQSPVRWIQDRQNFVSVYHDKAGLILGGGNTKLQPGWSNFTIGDIATFFHQPGDENPKFAPPAGVRHIPERAQLLSGGRFGVQLWYGERTAEIAFDIAGPDKLTMHLNGAAGLAAHVTVLPKLKSEVSSSAGAKAALGDAAWNWTPQQAGTWMRQGAVRIGYPAGAPVRWPVLPHDPYKKDGAATVDEARIVVDLPARSDVTVDLLP
jgi:hypothetical protein